MSSAHEAFDCDKIIDVEHFKKDSAASDLMCNIAIADITKVSVDDFMKQITLIEMTYFSAIKKAEFLSLKWNGRDKKIYAPNIVESTRWFNQLNFWVQKEILKYSAVNKRTEMLSFFIKLAKRLVDANNLYSAMSIVSAMQVECVYRLRLTWSGLGHRERIAYRRLEELFGQQDNCRLLREHTANMRLPGIPYLGLYLSDLTYTNVAHPRINGQPTTVWVTKLNTIVDAIAHFQNSRFAYQIDDSIRKYLLAQSYIEELQKFLEDANFKASLRLEPPLVIDPPPINGATPGTCPSSPPLPEIRRGNSVVPRVYPFSAPANGYASDQELKAKQRGRSVLEVSPALGGGLEVCCKAAAGLTGPSKCSRPPNQVALLDGNVNAVDKVGLWVDQMAKALGKDEHSGCKRPQQHQPPPSRCVHDKATPSPPRSPASRHDRAVQVPPVIEDATETSLATTTESSCLLCGHDLSSTPCRDNTTGDKPKNCSASETVVLSPTDSPRQSHVDFCATNRQSDILAPLPPRPSSADAQSKCPVTAVRDQDVYAAVMAAIASSGLPKTSHATVFQSASAFSDSGVATPPPTGSQWPPTGLAFFTSLRSAGVLCEGPIRRKVVGRLIPPGLDTQQQGSSSGEVSGALKALPEQRHTGNSFWKPYWAVLVATEGWVSAFVVYFDAVNRKPRQREDFSASHCQIQPFHYCAAPNPFTEDGSTSSFAASLPSIGPARHRNGTADDSSFLLTNPGLHKTYRIRPIGSLGQSSTELSAGGAPLTPTSQHRWGAAGSFFTLSRKLSTDSHSSFYSSLRYRGSSTPMLATATSSLISPQSPTMPPSSSPPTPRVGDWVRAVQTVLANLRV